MLKYDIVRINSKSTELLSKFLTQLGKGEKQFRYFQKRSYSVLKNHLVTILLLIDNNPVAYGHLDQENENVWLGIAVAQGYYGLGYGKKMMQTLMDEALSMNCYKIDLTVDLDNKAAISLYLKFGFEEIKRDTKLIHLRHSRN